MRSEDWKKRRRKQEIKVGHIFVFHCVVELHATPRGVSASSV